MTLPMSVLVYLTHSDIYVVANADGEQFALKLHR